METFLHVDVTSRSIPKRSSVSGDVVSVHREPGATVIVCADGLGSGPQAHLAATMTVTRAMSLLRFGFSLRQAMSRLVGSIDRARGESSLYTAFNLARVRRDGAATILGYDAPPPILVPRHGTPQVLGGRPDVVDEAIVTESGCYLRPGESLMLMSDGITQAGLGHGFTEGWTSEGVAHATRELLSAGTARADLPAAICRQAIEHWGPRQGDDCTVAIANCRPGERVTIFTGPPASPARDDEVVRRFVMMPGRKVICGGSTAGLVARVLHRKLHVTEDTGDPHTPPSSHLAGVDLVTEGAVSLNQLVNILSEPPENWPEDNPVCDLGRLLLAADRIDILHGTASNPAGQDFVYRQLGVLARRHVLPILAERLEALDKLVVIETV